MPEYLFYTCKRLLLPVSPILELFYTTNRLGAGRKKEVSLKKSMWRRRLDNLIKALGKNLSPLESVKIKKPPIQGMGRD